MNLNGRSCLLRFLCLFITAIFLRLVFLWISLTNLPVTSDEASSVLLAKMISRGEFPLLFLGQPYQFPIESYLMAPLVEWMPRSPFGARYQMIILGLLAVWGFILIARTAFSKGVRLAGNPAHLFPLRPIFSCIRQPMPRRSIQCP